MFSKYVFKSPVPDKGVVLYNSLNKSMIYIEEEVVDEHYLKKIDNESLLFMKDNYFLDNRELGNMVNSYILNNKYSTDIVSLTIHTNYSCNLRCNYCYQAGMDNNKIYMNEDMQRKIYKFILLLTRKLKPRVLDICFIGGEPLIMFDTIVSLVRRINCIPIKIRKYSVVTNGTLLSMKMYMGLRNLGISSFQITLDGEKVVHDSRRCFANKGGSFDIIMQNLCLISKSYAQTGVVINYNLDQLNANDVKGLFRVFRDYGLKLPVIFSLVFDSKYINTKTTVSGAQTVWLEAHKEAIRNGQRYDPFYRMSYIGCGCQRASSLIINPEGSIYKCISGIEDKDFYVGEISEFGTHRFSVNMSQFVERQLPEECNSCKYVLVCGGGCLYKNLAHGYRCLKGEIETNDIPLIGYQYGFLLSNQEI